MVSKESLFFVNFACNNPAKKDYHKIAKKMLYKKYTFGQFSYKRIFTNYLIFNYKCRLTLFFKEFLISDNSSEYLRNFYHKEDLINILGKILEIYCLYSKIYPNYIILNENKFLYKNIRKKQKMIDENNKNNEINYNNNDISNKSYELFTLSVRNEIKEFIENSNIKCNNDDNVSNKQINKISAKKINDNWVLMSNKKNQNVNMDKKKINNNKQIKNNSVDSFWTNDTNNLSTLLNAINDKILIDDKNRKKKENKNKKREINYRNINHKFKLLRNQNKLKKENNSSSKKPFNKNIFRKLDNNNILTENTRNNNFLKAKIKPNNVNNKNIKKPLSSSLTNKNNNKPSLVNKGNSMSKYLLTDKNWNKEIKNKLHQYYSLQKDSSDKNIGNDFKKIFKPFVMKKKNYSKDFPKHNKYLSINVQNLKYKFDNKRKKSPQEFLKIFFDASNTNIFNEKNKEENTKNGSFNTKIMYSTNSNFNSIRNRKLFLKKYFTNHNLNPKITNQRYTNNLTESNSQALINYIKENHFTYNNTNNNINDNKNNINDNKNNINDNKNDINDNKKEINDIKKNINDIKKNINDIKKNINENKIKTLNNCRTSTNYYILRNKNISININNNNKYNYKRQRTEGTNLAMRDIMINRGVVGPAYIKKKCFSPISNNYRRYTLSKSINIKKENTLNNGKKEILIHRQMINPGIKDNLINIKKNIRKQIYKYENNVIDNKSYLKNNSINKNNNSNNYDSSQKENNCNLNTLIVKENYRNNKKIYLRKNFSPTLTYFNLYKSGNRDFSNSKVNINNNSELIEFHHENLFIKKKNKNNKNNNNNNELNLNKLDNNENNLKIHNMKDKNMIKSKTEYSNFKPKYKIINKKEVPKLNINKKYILQRFHKKSSNLYIFSKDKNKINNLNEIAFQRFNYLSNSTINYKINNNNDITYKNISLSNSMKNISEFQTPLVQKKRLKLIKKFIYQEKKDKNESIPNNKDLNISSKVAIKVNRAKFLQRIKERKKNKISSKI